MQPLTPSIAANDERFHDLLAEFLRRTDTGEEVDQAAFMSAHPEFAEAFAEYFEGASVVEQMAGPRVDAAEPHATAHGQFDAETSVDFQREATFAKGKDQTGRIPHQPEAQARIPPQPSNRNEIPPAFGRYKILQELGQGAMGAVYLAEDTQLQRQVALKIPKFSGTEAADMLERFYREARAAAKLRHPNICPVYDVGEIGGQHYITMAFIEGRPLKDFAQAKKRQPEKQVAVVVRKLALGLAEAHAHGVIHRDLKPANIMVDKKGEPVVMDFGLARREEADDRHVTRSGAILGTPAYMSPEQVGGDQSKIGPPADIYSLGVVMYELLTGHVPFNGSLMSILMQIASEQPKPPTLHRSDLDKRLEAICLKMMAKQTSDRYGSMDEVAQVLGEYLKAPGSESAVGNALRGVSNETSRVGSVARQLETESPAPSEDVPAALTVVPTKSFAPTPARSASEELEARSVSEGSVGNALRGVPTAWLSASLRERATTTGNIWIATAVGLAAVVIFFAAVTFYVRLGKIDVKVVIHDKSLAVKFEGESIVFDDSGKRIRVWPGERKFIVEHNGVEAETDKFVVKKEGQNVLEVSLVDGHVVITKDGRRSLEKRDPGEKERGIASQPAKSSAGWPGWPKDAPPPAIAPFDVKQAKAHQEAWAAYLKVPVEYENSIGMKFRLIPPGEFMMGSTPEEVDAVLKIRKDPFFQECIKSEAPHHKVILTQPIYLGAHEVTQKDYATIVGAKPAAFSATGYRKEAVAGRDTATHPVEMVSWVEATDFCTKLSEREKLRPVYSRSGEAVTFLPGDGYRLPTDAQWEFACRAGTTTRFTFGDKDEDLPQAGWFGTNSGSRTHAVGELKPNALGLFDMHGNVWEWVQDWWDPAYFRQISKKAAIDPSGPSATSGRRVNRGGDWRQAAYALRSSSRYSHVPVSDRTDHIGFRVVLSVEAVRESVKHSIGPDAAAKDPLDLLKLVDANRDAVHGKWKLTADGLASDGSVPFCRLKLPYKPPPEYDFRVEFTAQGGNDILQLLSANGKSFTWLMGAWGGKYDGFDTVKDHPLTREGTNIVGGPTRIRRGQRHTSVVKVRRDSVSAEIDGKLVVRHPTDGADLGTPREWSLGEGAIGLGTTFDAVVFHKVEIVVPEAAPKSCDREVSGTVFPAYSADPLHLVKQKEEYAEVRAELEKLRKSSKQNYHVVIVPRLGDYLPRGAEYLRELVQDWKEQAASQRLPLETDRLVVVLMAANDQHLQIYFGPKLEDDLGLVGPPVTNELLVPHFLPYAKQGKLSEGIVSLLRGTEKWIVEHDGAGKPEPR